LLAKSGEFFLEMLMHLQLRELFLKLREVFQ
jgi:hypothetical protein